MYINNDSPIIIIAVYNAEDLNTKTGMNLSVGTYLYIISSESSINDGDYLIPTDGMVINDIVILYTEGTIKIDKRLYEDSGSKVSFTQFIQTGTIIGRLTIDDNNINLYAPSSPAIIFGTTEYEDGVTSLSNGTIYLQYEV